MHTDDLVFIRRHLGKRHGAVLDVGCGPGHLTGYLRALGIDVMGGMAATPDNLLTMVRRLPDAALWQVSAIGRHNLELTAIGLAVGGNARASLEDTLHLRKGALSPGSLPLVERTVALARDLNLSVAGVGLVRRLPDAADPW